MKILLVHNHYQQPGGEDAVFEAEKALLEHMGHEVIAFVEDNIILNKIGLLKAAVYAVWSRESIEGIRKIIKERKPDVAHFHNTFLRISPAAYYACKKAGIPVVQTLHNYRLVCPGALLMRDGRVCEACLGKVPPWPAVVHGCWRGSRAQTAVVAAMLAVHHWLKTWTRQVDVYIALTEFARQKFIEGGLPAEKIVVKPNFLMHDPLGVTNDSPCGTTISVPFALFAGRLSPEKGIRTLLRAWESLREIPLKIAGDGPLLDEVRRHAEKGLGNVEALGSRSHDEVMALMKGARCLVFPSECYEGFPMVVAEAFGCGLPVIASRLGAMAKIVEHGRTGLLLAPGNPNDLAAKVDWAWANPKEMAEMGKEARREYEKKYTPERNYEMLMAVYEKAKGQKKHG